MKRPVWLFIALLLTSCGIEADELRPGYLQLREISPDHYSVLWKLPARGRSRPELIAVFPENCLAVSQVQGEALDNAYLQRWMIHCPGGLADRDVLVQGLTSSSNSVLLRLEFLDDGTQTVQLTPLDPRYRVSARASPLQIASTYTGLGIIHILQGFDHLMFVFALLLIVRDWRVLIATITAFTLAHSITLAAATLGLVHVPQQPVEAVIALSILFLAMEWVHGRQGRPGAAVRWPWLIAFTFGLLHGFGFAGALAEVGLPQHAIPLALLFFNAGVEVGQLIFVAAVVLTAVLLRRILQPEWLLQLEMLAIYVVGSVSAFWFIDRVNAF